MAYNNDDNKKKDSIWSKTKKKNGSISSEYTKTYTTYSGHDMVAIFEIPLIKGSITHVVGELQTISYSMYNEKMPVRVLGDMNMKSIVFGNRTIAGSMVFTVFDRHWAHKMMDKYLAAMGSNAHILTDELPPINITISMANEYGDKSRLAIYGVTFVMEGQTMSIQDMYTENTFEYMAKDIDYLTNVTDANAASKGIYIDDQTKKMNKDIQNINNAAVDVPEKNNSPIVTDQTTSVQKTEWTISVNFSKEDYEKGYKYCLERINEIYNSKNKELEEQYKQKKISKNDYVEAQKSLKKSLKNAKQKLDAEISKNT